MECDKCGKEITLTEGVVYCPYCGVKLASEESTKRKGVLSRELKIPHGVKPLIVWALLCVVIWWLSVLFGELSSFLSRPEFPTWIGLALTGGLALYITLAYVVYDYAKKHHRRAVAWTTAFIVFAGILAGLALVSGRP